MKNTRPALVCIGFHTQPKPLLHLLLPLSIRHPNYPRSDCSKLFHQHMGLCCSFPTHTSSLAARDGKRCVHPRAIPTTPGKDNASVGPAAFRPGAALSRHCPVPVAWEASRSNSPGQPGGVSVEETFNYTPPGVFPVAEGRPHSLYVSRVPLVLFDN